MEPRALLRQLMAAALAAARPERLVAAWLPSPPRGRTLVVGAGKAAASMAVAVEAAWSGPLAGRLSGLVITRHGARLPTRHITLVEAGHPLPDGAGAAAAAEMLEAAAALGPDDLLLCLVSGGASALMALPAPGLTLADLRHVTDRLLRVGAPIDAINRVRRQLSRIAGGRLAAAAAPAPVVTLALSDVVGDDPLVIGSGPTVAETATPAEAQAILARHGIDPGPRVAAHLARPSEAPRHLPRSDWRLIGRGLTALEAAAATARQAGLTALVLGDRLAGEARAGAGLLAALAAAAARDGVPAVPPLVLLSGGEFTVTVTGPGRGGPNTEAALALALALDGLAGCHALLIDTDGLDGAAGAAGALVAPDTLARAAAFGLDPAAALAGNDSAAFFAALGDLVETGPTYTNVNDFRAILVLPP